MISTTDFIVFCNRTLDGYERALARLDDTTVNATPEVAFANGSTPAQLITHALGATTWWTSHMVAGHPSDRDREGEFTATATVPELNAGINGLRRTLDALAPELAAATELAEEPSLETPLDGEWTVGCALIHAYEELAQHLGHLEITTDLLAAPPPDEAAS